MRVHVGLRNGVKIFDEIVVDLFVAVQFQQVHYLEQSVKIYLSVAYIYDVLYKIRDYLPFAGSYSISYLIICVRRFFTFIEGDEIEVYAKSV